MGLERKSYIFRLHCLRDRNEDNRTVEPGAVWLNGRREKESLQRRIKQRLCVFLVVVAPKKNPLIHVLTFVSNEDLINCVNATVWVDAR